jgi:hypothetical protein
VGPLRKLGFLLENGCSRSSCQVQGIDRKSILHKIGLRDFQSSTKLEALVEELTLMQVHSSIMSCRHLGPWGLSCFVALSGT